MDDNFFDPSKLAKKAEPAKKDKKLESNLIIDGANALDLSAHEVDMDSSPAPSLSLSKDGLEKRLNADPPTKQMLPEFPEEKATTLAFQREMSDSFFKLVLCELTFADMVKQSLQILMKASSAEAGAIMERDNKIGDFFFRAAEGKSAAQIMSFRVPEGKGIVGHVAESKSSLLLSNAGGDQRHLASISTTVGFEAKCCIAIPIIVANQLYGVFEVFNKIGSQEFNHLDLELLESGIAMFAKVLEVRFFVAELLK